MLHVVNDRHVTPSTPAECRAAQREAPVPPLRVSSDTGESPTQPAPADRELHESRPPELDAERIAVIRERYASGAYDSVPLLTEVARRLLADGDV